MTAFPQFLRWNNFSLSIPPKMRSWLHYRHSFIERLKRRGIAQPKIRILFQGWRNPLASEQQRLRLKSRHWVFVREVCIHSDDKQWMLARVVFPCTLLQGKWQCFMRLGTKPLGSILFKHKFTRSDFEMTKIADDRYARRSIFFKKDKRLLLTEIFLPDVFSL